LFADDVAGFTWAIGLERAYVSGVSLGGATALWLAGNPYCFARTPDQNQIDSFSFCGRGRRHVSEDRHSRGERDNLRRIRDVSMPNNFLFIEEICRRDKAGLQRIGVGLVGGKRRGSARHRPKPAVIGLPSRRTVFDG
jgi:hypothetical protein